MQNLKYKSLKSTFNALKCINFACVIISCIDAVPLFTVRTHTLQSKGSKKGVFEQFWVLFKEQFLKEFHVILNVKNNSKEPFLNDKDPRMERMIKVLHGTVYSIYSNKAP